MRVRLIPTGQCELIALAASLSQVFPGHDFEAVPLRVEPDGRRNPFDGFTSARLTPGLIPDSLRRIVEKAASEVLPGRDGYPADSVIILDDLELENCDQVAIVADTVRAATRQHLAKLERERGTLWAQRVANALRARASFHLAVPMIEAWFFGDHDALQRAGCPAGRLPPNLEIGCDPEAFETADATFSLDDGSACAALIARNARAHKADRPRWVLPSRPTIPRYRREAHPKAYLTWLCRDPEHERCSTYREAEGGAAALVALRWSEVLGDPSHFVWARALIGDLADVLSVSLPDLTEGERGSFLRGLNEHERIFRNL